MIRTSSSRNVVSKRITLKSGMGPTPTGAMRWAEGWVKRQNRKDQAMQHTARRESGGRRQWREASVRVKALAYVITTGPELFTGRRAPGALAGVFGAGWTRLAGSWGLGNWKLGEKTYTSRPGTATLLCLAASEPSWQTFCAARNTLSTAIPVLRWASPRVWAMTSNWIT
ncbi:hypothetical protein CIHG_05926 [Coccidioides immitis H538.4]|uniref:Uncharacterized protein n=3 Tax=Coccidioides immitis TaxID=5501 RepID=A0A0J8QYM5_COCIT|nr:hypothetical protein CIRG_01679 [Coccidioides immitis RMSCC 2394]KMU76483.1 hypothetical protein CISG_01217 [Coccidioides immitis RMSCC 3703]KMU87534.1 hypothetical protein CIHG_05926 [Coccidioides immitis H538.4]